MNSTRYKDAGKCFKWIALADDFVTISLLADSKY